MKNATVATITKPDGRIYARLRYPDAFGKTKEIYRRAKTKTHARELKRDLLAEFEAGGTNRVESEAMTFNQAADAYAAHKHVPAEFAGDKQIAGLRSLKSAQYALKTLRAHFGAQTLRLITPKTIELYKRQRLQTTSRRGALLAPSSVNRELALLRSVFRFAVREDWIQRSPFDHGANLISQSDERARHRLLSPAEEVQLLAACTGRRLHLRAIVICALDTGMRRGEILSLTWGDIDRAQNLIHVRAAKTKTLESRFVAITPRLQSELRQLWESSEQDRGQRVFGIATDIKKSFKSACEEAGITGLQFRDLRRTCNTRMQAAGIPQSFTMKILGHTQQQTNSEHYTALPVDVARQAAAALAQFTAQMSPDLSP